MNTQFKKGALELIVLLIIKREDQYGYSLVQNISRYMTIAEGTVYPLLRRLQRTENYRRIINHQPKDQRENIIGLLIRARKRLALLKEEWQMFSNAVNTFVEESERNE